MPDIYRNVAIQERTLTYGDWLDCAVVAPEQIAFNFRVRTFYAIDGAHTPIMSMVYDERCAEKACPFTPNLKACCAVFIGGLLPTE